MRSKKNQLLLKSKALWNIVCGTEQPPNITGDAAYKMFSRRRETALSTLLLLVDESFVAPVLEMDDPSEVWKALRAQYQSVSQGIRDSLLDAYQAMRMNRDESVVQYHARRSQLESHLGGVGYAVSEGEMLSALLRGLTTKFDVMAEVIRGLDKTLADGMALLIAKEAFLSNSKNFGDSSVKALNVESKPKRKRRFKCYHCGRLGHQKAD